MQTLSALPILFAPIGLILVHAISVPVLVYGRRAIMMGNWMRHRNFMLGSCFVFTMMLSLTIEMIVVMLFKGFSVAGITGYAMWAVLALHLAALTGLLVMLPWTLYRVARHLLLPHKMMARWTIKLWFAVAGTGIAAAIMIILAQMAG